MAALHWALLWAKEENVGSGEDSLSPGDEVNEHTIVGLIQTRGSQAGAVPVQWSDLHTLSCLILSAVLIPI